ncbi:MAG: glycosyl hydrolase, partial [Thermogutta sp.]|nr:glycosyl hydrolase [Thermogutta sp.]
FADLYADTGDERYLRLSRRFHHRAILEPLAEGVDILPGKHANTQIPKLIGLAARYELAGDPKDRAAAAFFWDRVVNHHSYITGGNGDHEHFGPPDRLNDRLTTNTTETCNVYNMLKLTRYVFGWNPDARVADFYERALLNHIRATQHPDGRVIYNLSLKPGHYKEYQPLHDAWTCCMGTGMENHVRYGDFIYFHDEAGLWVNLYIASELHWRDLGVRVRLDAGRPYDDTAVVTMDCRQPREFTLRLRHPHWARQGISARVRGAGADEPETYERDGDAAPGYLEITRRWQSGDRVEIRFPMSLRTESMPDNPDRIGIFYGPTLLAADLGPVNNPEADKPGFVPVLVTDRRPVSEWVKPVASSELTFRTEGVGRPRDVALTPFFSLHDRRYTVYLDLFTEEDWAKRQAEIRAEEQREAELAARTVDVLRIGEMQPERDHNLQGERTGAGEALGRKWRHATDGGWFSFQMRVDPDQPMELVCTYWGSDGGGHREFEILVDGVSIAAQKLENNAPNRFFDAVYPIPAELTRGKSQVTIRFQARPGKWAGGVFGVRTMRAESSR